MTKPYTKIDVLGTIYYYKDANCTIHHREDGPAIEYANGSKAWYLNGLCHRIYGPAIEYADGYKTWWLNDKKCSEEEHKRLVKMIAFI